MIEGIVEKVASSDLAAFVSVGEDRYLVYGHSFVLGETVQFEVTGRWRSTSLVVGARLLRKGVLVSRAPQAA